MATQYKGNFIIMNAAGTVLLAGRANLFTNSTPSAAVSDVSPVVEHEDSTGIIRTLTRNKTAYEMTLTLTPGIGGKAGGTNFASLSELKTAADLVPLGSTIITEGFPIEALNWTAAKAYKGRITASSVNASGNGPLSMNVTARRECSVSGSTETPIDFTGAWADL
jgi:hypothetical protein